MAATIDPFASEFLEQDVITRAADAGYRLVQYETERGQLIWEWRNTDGRRPQFVTRRVAVRWMAELLSQ